MKRSLSLSSLLRLLCEDSRPHSNTEEKCKSYIITLQFGELCWIDRVDLEHFDFGTNKVMTELCCVGNESHTGECNTILG